MNLELFNKTNMVKEVPKYNYNGKIRIPSLGTYPIKDYMVSFYKPYAKAGVIVRVAKEQEEVIEEEVKTVIEENTKEPVQEPKVEEVKVEETVDKIEDVVEEVKEETTETSTEEPKVEEVKVEKTNYKETELQELKLNELKDIADGLGLTVDGDLKKKATYIDAILASQK